MISRLVLLKPESSSVRMIADSRSVFTRSSSSYYYPRSVQHGCAKVGGKKKKKKKGWKFLGAKGGKKGGRGTEVTIHGRSQPGEIIIM